MQDITGSQCKFLGIGIMCSHSLFLDKICAVILAEHMEHEGTQWNSELQ